MTEKCKIRNEICKFWENLKCEKCGGEMELEKITEFEEVKSCKDCGWKVLFIKKLRDDLEWE